MGTDNLFHKRRAKKAKELSRRKARKQPYDKVLIVCEGEKTEPHYFNGLKDHYSLNSANIEICSDCGPDPLGIYKYARRRYFDEKANGDPFDRVYCVFDKDTHGTYQRAVDEIQRARPAGTFMAINSVPCFEYWLLLHFNSTTRPYAPLPGNSACNQVLTELRKYMPDYSKGNAEIFSLLVEKMDFAIGNADHALQIATDAGTDNPTTRVHELVRYLRNIKGLP